MGQRSATEPRGRHDSFCCVCLFFGERPRQAVSLVPSRGSPLPPGAGITVKWAQSPPNQGPDPSLVYRPEGHPEAAKDKGSFRNYTSGPLLDRVFATYKLMHTHQTVDFVRKKHAQFRSFSYKRMTVLEAVDMLDGLVDESDPDVDFPNSFHAFQTAEGIRQAHPDKDWFHLVGLLHDLGKVLALAGEPQWAVVGDTFPVGCRPQASVVFHDSTFQDNPDLQDPRYSSDLGMYQPHCGLENVLMSWGHDEYMYQVMKFNSFSLPPEAFYMIRFHSFYPWHTGGGYRQLCNRCSATEPAKMPVLSPQYSFQGRRVKCVSLLLPAAPVKLLQLPVSGCLV
ncbi:Inositol oxygenase [Myotis brandtii]|uniref:Inositol oxygenase n=1 Tax=Myotis brandtii TaxID=109478 RepID=S7MZJ1_MYOBR|nr:Inositol oxygenase [Myotis brandtii]